MEKFDPKDPNEILPLPFSFKDDLNGQTIASAVVLVETYTGVDASPMNILSGAYATVGDTIRQNVTGGVVDAEYLIRVTVTTNGGLKYTLGKVLPVKRAGTW